jgi:hypothetical protein
MSSLYKQFETDQELESKGIVINYGKNSRGENIDIRIARAGGQNTRFQKVAEQVLKPYRRQIANESVDNAVLEDLMRTVYARSVILGWSGVDDKEGEPLPFTEENVVKLLRDLPNLFADIREAAEKQTLFRRLALEDEAKNSQTS